jgi:tetratricopeptide (TPR) repeat protein
MTTKQLILTIAAALLVSGSPAIAGKKEDAKKHLAKAMALHKEGKFDEALVELQAAYTLDPKPDYLYAIAQLDSKLGRCADATTFYKSFLATQKDPQVKTVVEQAIAACVEATPPAPDKPVAPPDKPDTPPDKPVAPPDKPAPPPDKVAMAPDKPKPFSDDPPIAVQTTPVRRHWYSDKLGLVLVVGGVAASAGGFVLFRSATSDLDLAEDHTKTNTLASYNSLVDRAHSKRTYAVIAGGAGAALVLGGVLHMMFRSSRVETTHVGVVPGNGGGVVTLEGGF